jgi:tetratricopeptide (TPR) repeat protein
MKKTLFIFLYILLPFIAFSQRPSKEQMEADKKRLAEAMQKLNQKTSKMDPKAKKGYDSLLNQYGIGQKMDNAIKQVNNTQATKSAGVANGLVPAKNTKAIAAIVATPSKVNMGAFIGNTGNTTFAAVLPAAKNKADEIYTALKEKGASIDEMGNAATVLWMQGRIQIALSMMAKVCKDNPTNIDNLNNYAAMLTMMGAPNMAIPMLNNLNARFKNNSTILNNLGQAWFALGEIDKSKKYLDSTLLIAATHTQANETLCLIAESKGNKTAALAYAKAAFKQGNTQSRKERLKQLGYAPGADDYTGFPRTNKSDDLLNLGNFSPMEFPKSYAAMKMYETQWKQFSVAIDQAIKPLQKLSEESNKQTTKRLEEQQKQFMNAMNKTLANPGSVNQSSAMQTVGIPMFSEKMNAKEKIVLQNLQLKKDRVLQKMADFAKGDGATYKKEYNATLKKINERWKNVGEGGTENNEVLCNECIKAVDTYLSAYNTKSEELYKEYLVAQKQFLNEMAYLSLYTTYAELLPGINAGLKQQWLKTLAFKAEVLQVTYGCASPGKIKEGKLTEFKDPNCNINSEFSQTLGIANLGFKMKLDCSGLTTEFNALFVGVKLNQDLDHAGFGDSYKSCTVSIGPKTSVGGKVGPLEASVNVGGGFDVEIDRNGAISDVVVKAGAEIEAGLHNPGIKDTGALGTAAAGSAGVEGRVSLISGAGSIQGTGIFNK